MFRLGLGGVGVDWPIMSRLLWDEVPGLMVDTLLHLDCTELVMVLAGSYILTVLGVDGGL